MKFRKGFYFDDDLTTGGGDADKDKIIDNDKDKGQGDQKTVPYERFKEVVDKANTYEKRIAELTEAETKKQEAALKEQNKWKDLYEKRDAEAKEKERELLRVRVASKKGVPADLIDRLRGETEEELEADADKLIEFIKIDTSTGNPLHRKGGQGTRLDIKTMTPEEIRKNAGTLLSQGKAE